MTGGSHQEAWQAGLVTALKEGRLGGDGADRGRLLRWGCGRNGCGGEPEVGFELMYEVPGRSEGLGLQRPPYCWLSGRAGL